MDDLLDLALKDPERAHRGAEQLIARSGDPAELSVAHQALAIVRREDGLVADALSGLRSALRFAELSRQPNRVADVRATYGATLVIAGRTKAGLRSLDRAAAEAQGDVLPTVLMRRAMILTVLGRHRPALDDMTAALEGIRRSGSLPWLARTLNNLGHIQLSLGLADDAERSLVEAVAIYEAEDSSLETLHTRINLGRVAFTRGDLPGALAAFNRIDPADAQTGRSLYNLVAYQCDVLLAAGLAVDAVELLGKVPMDALPTTERPNLLLDLAQAKVAIGDLRAAGVAAAEARAVFRDQQRAWFELRARWVGVRAQYLLGETVGIRREASAVARALHEERADEAPPALTLAGRLATGSVRGELLDAASGYRVRANPLVRAGAWLAHAVERDTADDRGGTLRACGSGLDALDEHRRTMGSSELRALATGHGRELAELALRSAAHDPRTLLRWSERWRATSLAQPRVTPDGVVPVTLAALRDLGRELAEARADGDPTEDLEQEKERLERAIRAEHRQRADPSGADAVRFQIDSLVATVADGVLVELVDVDGVLHVLVVNGGRVRRHVAGATSDALALAEHGRSALRRAAHGRPFDLGDLGSRLQEALLGPASRLPTDGPLIIAPTARLHGAPWGLLPGLFDRPFSLVPSAAQWLRACAVRRPEAGPLVLLAGPGLGTGGAEVPMLARLHPDAVLLKGADATVEAALRALDGAGLAHVAAHGRFRADSPLFSSLEFADGQLTVYELEQLTTAPYRLVLSACESGVLAPVGAEELLGLGSALFALGSAGMVCTVAEVNDAATPPLMVELHRTLEGGADLAAALHGVRRLAAGDPTAEATAAAFVALGC